jgi:transcriptional regulator with XRE-family HTH domain
MVTHARLGLGSIRIGRLEDARLGTRAENGIGTRVRAARQRLGWNREALAFHSGISWSAIAQVETGRRTNLRPSTLQSLARALGVTIDYLVAGGGRAVPMLAHRALLYASEAEFLDAAAPFLAEGTERGEAVLAVTSDANIELLKRRLGDRASEVEFRECSSWHETAAQAFLGYRAFLDSRLEAGAPWVRILGEPPWSSRCPEQLHTWMRYEALLTLAFASRPVTVTCPYDVRGLDEALISHARAIHPHDGELGGAEDRWDFTDSVGLALGP